jgi:RND family efflux transporter MFP subunit
MTKKRTKRNIFRKKAFWIILIVLALAAGGGYAYYALVYKPGQVSPEPIITTSQVRQGDVVISVSGSGTLVATSEATLGFEKSGYLEEVYVAVGDQVKKDDILATMETDELELAIIEADIRVRLAQIDLDNTLEGPTKAELASAEASIKNAEVALQVAQLSYNSDLNSDVDSAASAHYLNYLWRSEKYLEAQEAYAAGKIGQSEYEDAVNKWRQAEADLNDALVDADLEQLGAANDIDQARNDVYQAMERLESLESGATEEKIKEAELELEQAELALDDARADLEAATLRAPFDGTVVEVTALPGEYIGKSSFITLAALEEPLLEFWVEESDMSGVAMGSRVEIIFEALPDETFTGQVVQVDPTLVTVDRTLAIQALSSIDTTSYSGDLLGGMNAEIEVISAESRDTLLVPLQALRELGEDSYAVFVVQPDGELEMHIVEVGLQDMVNAEIISGLEAGELVSTGVAESTETGVFMDEQQMPGEPGTRMLEGGGGMPGGGGPPPGRP